MNIYKVEKFNTNNGTLNISLIPYSGNGNNIEMIVDTEQEINKEFLDNLAKEKNVIFSSDINGRLLELLGNEELYVSIEENKSKYVLLFNEPKLPKKELEKNGRTYKF